MAGLKGANTEIGDDGLTVTVKTESEATARELAADLETRVRTAEGGFGAKFNNKLANSLNRFDETLGIYGDRMLQILRDVLTVCAMALAAFAWFRILPGYEPLMAVIGMAIVYAMKTAAGRLDKAEREGDIGLRNLLGVVIVGGLILEVLASLSLQAASSVDRETGRTDVNSQIEMLQSEERRLSIRQMGPNPGVPAQMEALVNSYRATPMVNRAGSQLTRTVGEMADATDCNPDSEAGRRERTYIGMYCPTLRELQGQVEAAKAFEHDSARLEAIPAEIQKLQASRPSASSTFALAQKGGDWAWLLSIAIPLGLTVALNLTMLLLAYLAGRAKRTPVLELTEPLDANGGQA